MKQSRIALLVANVMNINPQAMQFEPPHTADPQQQAIDNADAALWAQGLQMVDPLTSLKETWFSELRQLGENHKRELRDLTETSKQANVALVIELMKQRRDADYKAHMAQTQAAKAESQAKPKADAEKARLLALAKERTKKNLLLIIPQYYQGVSSSLQVDIYKGSATGASSIERRQHALVHAR
eukprot:Protomagalhaensia_sp_Gyna_25__1100@NODE_1537_length_1756_cov_67_498544_g473_i1_p2_GENE_NODE_1537_length_1756_cov_67_498544_g473_i1NODE_1537_length_1756_cov_67_498544_g473_i1_p2_ORF_typecomplete_len193_score26_81DUF3482/PF11981_8/0_018DUF4549/PF15082_6/0_16Regnase_1_C/PF18561_1/2_8e02Regnase_1_C/PF18561_1/2_6e03_NODE_1537_length_1756_cov_67_498544_g473_i111781729